MPDIHDNVEQIFLCYNICILYQDGRQEPRGGQQYRTLTNPRWISQRNHPDEDLPDTRYTHMVMQFGQFLDHDLTLTPKDGNAPGVFEKTISRPLIGLLPPMKLLHWLILKLETSFVMIKWDQMKVCLIIVCLVKFGDQIMNNLTNQAPS